MFSNIRTHDNLAVPLYVIEWNQILALAQSNGIVSLETPPSTAGHLHPEGLPELLAAVDRFSGDLRRAIVTAFFEARGTPVMYRMEGQPKSPSTEPVVKPDGTIVHPDVEPEERWYAVTRGRNVGVVQGDAISLEWTNGVYKNERRRAKTEAEAVERFVAHLAKGQVTVPQSS